MKLLIWIYLIWNAVAFLMMGLDKWKAKRGVWRTPEWVLLSVAFLCGAAGALLGMYIFWHKVRKVQFAVGIPVMLGLQLLLAWYLYDAGYLCY